MKYEVKLELAEDDWIYITEDNSENCWDLTVKIFDNIKDAEQFASIWKQKNTKVVEYND
jgi:hypothetical protein